MRYREVERRLEQLEAEARRQEQKWLESLSDEELEALCAAAPPELRAAFDAMTDDEIEQAVRDDLDEDEIIRRYHAKRQASGVPDAL
jgi:hypothetical protein